jgi:hypothetical protein
MTDTTNTAAEPTVRVTFSRDRRLYYVNRYDFHRPRSWVGVEPDADGRFEQLPFAFYEVKGGESEELPESHELVQRYVRAESWPERGSDEWVRQLLTVRQNVDRLLVDAEQSVRHYRDDLKLYDALARAHAPWLPPASPEPADAR